MKRQTNLIRTLPDPTNCGKSIFVPNIKFLLSHWIHSSTFKNSFSLIINPNTLRIL
uniref:Uncharacterized protein n=1 Tax=Meloidogyne incognita TaxID=6306 RepID=A0A914MJG4_MELIC